jgi:hypothetical protein
MRVNFHFWEFGEVWEVFAKGGDGEGGEGPSKFWHHIHNERCKVWELEEFKDVGNPRAIPGAAQGHPLDMWECNHVRGRVGRDILTCLENQLDLLQHRHLF